MINSVWGLRATDYSTLLVNAEGKWEELRVLQKKGCDWGSSVIHSDQ